MSERWKNYALRHDRDDEAVADAVWYACPIERRTLRDLIRRSDGPALRFFALWLMLLLAAGVAAFFSWGHWWALPAFFVYGVLYAVADHRHHELSHGTAFRTRWLNEMFYHLCAFM